jgi:tRNA ligase
MEGLSHAQVGEAWLDRGLKKARKSRADLAERLWKENWTLVTEVGSASKEKVQRSDLYK